MYAVLFNYNMWCLQWQMRSQFPPEEASVYLIAYLTGNCSSAEKSTKQNSSYHRNITDGLILQGSKLKLDIWRKFLTLKTVNRLSLEEVCFTDSPSSNLPNGLADPDSNSDSVKYQLTVHTFQRSEFFYNMLISSPKCLAF